jgi:chemotaxis signal transduction protein
MVMPVIDLRKRFGLATKEVDNGYAYRRRLMDDKKIGMIV